MLPFPPFSAPPTPPPSDWRRLRRPERTIDAVVGPLSPSSCEAVTDSVSLAYSMPHFGPKGPPGWTGLAVVTYRLSQRDWWSDRVSFHIRASERVELPAYWMSHRRNWVTSSRLRVPLGLHCWTITISPRHSWKGVAPGTLRRDDWIDNCGDVWEIPSEDKDWKVFKSYNLPGIKARLKLSSVHVTTSRHVMA